MIDRGLMGRRHDVDFVRVAVFFLLMIYHASLIFGTRGWLVHSDNQSRAFDVISLVSHPWRISLLFFIAGITTAGLGHRHSPADIRDRRTRQLIPPLLIGIFVLVPPQIYLLAISDFGLDMSYLSFWGLYLRFGSISDASGNDTSVVCMQHVWFLAYLWLYTVMATLLMSNVSDGLARLRRILGRVLRGYGLFLWPVVYLVAMRIAVYPLFGETLDMVGDWYAHAVYFCFFMLGMLMADSEDFWREVVERRRFAAWGAYLALGIIVALFVFYPPAQRGLTTIIVHRVARSTLQWFAIVAILGYCRVLITRANPVITYLNRAMLTYYVLHQTVLLLVAYWLKRTFGFDGWSFAIIVVSTMVICAVLYEIQRHAKSMIKRLWQRIVVADVQPSAS